MLLWLEYPGSTKIGNNVLIGGKVGFSGHLNIGNNVKIAAGSGVIKDIKDNESVGGYPAQPIFEWHRSTINLKVKKKCLKKIKLQLKK